MLWDAKLETGVDRIDNQHRELCRLVDILLNRTEETNVDQTLKFLGDYVVQHFADEEALQVASKYPALPEHKGLHTDFIKVFLDLKGQLNSAETQDDKEIVILSLNGTVVDWLSNHIMVHDRRFAEWYKEHTPN